MHNSSRPENSFVVSQIWSPKVVCNHGYLERGVDGWLRRPVGALPDDAQQDGRPHLRDGLCLGHVIVVENEETVKQMG